MAVGTLLSASVWLNELDASPFVSEVGSPFSVDMLDATTLSEGGFSKMTPGLRHGEMTAAGFQDFASGGFYASINQADLGANALMSIVPGGTSASAGDPAAFIYGPLDQITEGDGPVGDLAKIAVHVAQQSPFCMGVLASPTATRTTTATGTVIAFAGPSATEAWYAGLHVFSGSGGNLIVTVKSDDAVGFSSATTRITFSTATGATSELKSIAGSFSGETHARVDWSVSAGSFSFAVVLARISLV